MGFPRHRSRARVLLLDGVGAFEQRSRSQTSRTLMDMWSVRCKQHPTDSKKTRGTIWTGLERRSVCASEAGCQAERFPHGRPFLLYFWVVLRAFVGCDWPALGAAPTGGPALLPQRHPSSSLRANPPTTTSPTALDRLTDFLARLQVGRTCPPSPSRRARLSLVAVHTTTPIAPLRHATLPSYDPAHPRPRPFYFRTNSQTHTHAHIQGTSGPVAPYYYASRESGILLLETTSTDLLCCWTSVRMPLPVPVPLPLPLPFCLPSYIPPAIFLPCSVVTSGRALPTVLRPRRPFGRCRHFTTAPQRLAGHAATATHGALSRFTYHGLSHLLRDVCSFNTAC